MRILFFGNGPVAVESLKLLKESGNEVAGVVLHPPASRRLGDEIIAASGVAEHAIWDANALKDPGIVSEVSDLGADVGLSVLFAHILKPDVLQLFPRGVLNVHPGYLPFNRGRNAQIWGIVERTPVGATLHYMDEGVDTGPIVERIEVATDPTDTGASLRAKLEAACVDVLRAGWPSVVAGVAPTPQDRSEGTRHLAKDVEAIQEIDLDATYKAGELIDRLRALTSAPQSDGAFFTVDGKRVRMTVSLEEEVAGE